MVRENTIKQNKTTKFKKIFAINLIGIRQVFCMSGVDKLDCIQTRKQCGTLFRRER